MGQLNIGRHRAAGAKSRLVALPEKWFWDYFDLSGSRVYQALGRPSPP